MDALQCYGSSSDSDSDDEIEKSGSRAKRFKSDGSLPLPPPPPELFTSIPDAVLTKRNGGDHGGRVRSFPHVPGNFALHVYIPVTLSASIQANLAPYLQKAVSLFPDLKPMEDDELNSKQGFKEPGEFHISLGRTCPIRIHQADTMVHMLRQKMKGENRFPVEFSSWEVFVNDDRTRTFLSLEVLATGYGEIKKQVSLVDDVYRLHSLPTFYKDPRPHISLAWALGDVKEAVAAVTRALNAMANPKCVWTCLASKVECKIGQKLHSIWTSNL
jgi:2'-5' RNA ligase